MKRIALFTAFVAALSLVSCKKEDSVTPVTLERVTFQAQETKAVFDTPSGTDYPTLWTANDTRVAISYNYTGSSSPVSVALTPASGGQSASFTAEFPTGESSYEFIAVSPAAVVKSWNAGNKTANLEIAAGQTSTLGSPDEAAMILYGKEGPYTTLPKDVDMTFHHFTGYLHLVFTNYEAALSAAGATVQSVSISSTKDIAGRFFFKPEDGSVTVNSGAKTISVATTSLDHVWAALVPVDLSGETLSFVVATDKGTLTQDVTLPASRNLTSGTIAKITVDMSGKAVVPPVQYNLVTAANQLHVGDKVIIVVANADIALSTTQNTNNRASTSVVKGSGVISDPSAAVEVITLEDGAVPGEFALKTSGGGYLYAAGGDSSNHLKTAAADAITPATAPLGSFDIQILNGQDNGTTGSDLHEPAEGTTDNVAWIQAKAVPRGIMFYNGIKHASNKLFSCYAATASYTSFLQIYRLDAPAADHFSPSMPRANAEGNVTVAAAGEALKVNVFSSVAWTATGTAAALLDKTSGTGNDVLTLTVPENTGSTELAYQLVISTTAPVTPNSYTFNLSQLAPVTGGASVDDVLWAENWVGGVKNQTPAQYQSSVSSTGTTVYGGGSVVYSQNGESTKLYTEGLVYLVNNKGTQSPGDYLSSDKINNLLVSSGGGWFKVAGIPCQGVKTAVLTYYSNTKHTGRNITVTTDTANVSASALSEVEKSNTYTYTADSSSQTKPYYEVTCTISFDTAFTGSTFNIQFNNGYSSNIRIANLGLVVTEVW